VLRVGAPDEERQLLRLQLGAQVADGLAVRPAVVVGRLAHKVDPAGLVVPAQHARPHPAQLRVQLGEDGVRAVGGRLGHGAQPVQLHGHEVGVGHGGGRVPLQQALLHLEEDEAAQPAQPAAERVPALAGRPRVHQRGDVEEQRVEPLQQGEAGAAGHRLRCLELPERGGQLGQRRQ
jgi:hypothetical protein